MLHRMVLTARSTIDTGPAALTGPFGSVLASCMRSSVSENVTGGLVVEAGLFLKVLEGANDALCVYHNRVVSDGRLQDLQVLEFVPVLDREYATWAIAATEPDAARPDLIEAVSEKRAGSVAVSQHVRRVLMAGVLAETPPLCVAA